MCKTCQMFPAPPDAPTAASLIPATPGFILSPENKSQYCRVGWGRLLSSKSPAPLGSAAQTTFFPAAPTTPLFTISGVTAAAKAFNQNWAGQHTHRRENTHSRKPDIWNKPTSHSWENLDWHFHVPGREQYGEPRLLQEDRTHIVLRMLLLLLQVTPTWHSLWGGCYSAQHLRTGPVARCVMDWPHTEN